MPCQSCTRQVLIAVPQLAVTARLRCRTQGTAVGGRLQGVDVASHFPDIWCRAPSQRDFTVLTVTTFQPCPAIVNGQIAAPRIKSPTGTSWSGRTIEFPAFLWMNGIRLNLQSRLRYFFVSKSQWARRSQIRRPVFLMTGVYVG